MRIMVIPHGGASYPNPSPKEKGVKVPLLWRGI